MALESIDGVRVPARDLSPFVIDIFKAAGADQPSAEAVAAAVVDASARAFDTHGVRLVPFYMRGLEGGRINSAPHLDITRKAPAVAHVDADDGFGHLASYRAIEEGCAIAAETGVAVVTVGRSSHHGATGCYTRTAATKGFAAIGMTHADSAVIPFGGTKAFFGTNPLSFAIPVAGEDPILLDMATSAIPFNRVQLRQATGTPLPEEVAIDKNGAFTTDPNAAVAVGPVGGARFGYKGSGLATMVDLLCSAFTGMAHGRALAAFGGPDFATPIPIGHFFIILSPALFQTLSLFDARIASFLADLRAQPGKDGRTVHAPGDIEKAEARRRLTEGLPIDRVTWAALSDFSTRFGVALPLTIS
ncbi:Ldh family oxidoreductase [Kaistia dalseonensis]|uniref:LDH2 family malate/lactate/ureidoglycolate dehydrogenase n=1 Tax=Kaistia dalseonensis TaxID=410840 RepID=A0ABU0H2U5_9HYPH|nr:Ldh family oxidoreductase [Kaistia dalseonensis]MCX5494048.1 Ldh family oxidoreductase [Kaistia dalseonensis]MDQ0436626.1 LDH2 family malate/lactate/ureidoglycolate dehydrogenase [Kaistia dalseonensis]